MAGVCFRCCSTGSGILDLKCRGGRGESFFFFFPLMFGVAALERLLLDLDGWVPCLNFLADAEGLLLLFVQSDEDEWKLRRDDDNGKGLNVFERRNDMPC